MTTTGRRMRFAGREHPVLAAPVIKAILAGWSMNTYIQPMPLNGQLYRDGGGTFYDIGIFTACLDASLTNMVNIHLDEPIGHSYNLPPRPNLVQLIFDTHNYTGPEERRRMRLLSNLLYDHYRLRAETAARLAALPPVSPAAFDLAPDFRQYWEF